MQDGKPSTDSPLNNHAGTAENQCAPAEPTEAALIDATLAGDRSAYDQLVLRHQDRLFGSLLRMTGSAEDAQEIAQEAFVQAYVQLDRFQRTAAFYTWLYRIAMNRAISRSRKRRERTSLDGLRETAGVDPIVETPQPDEHLLSQERTELVHQALGKLNEEHRQVMVLRELEGFDYQQIAEILGTPVGTVRSRLFRARMQLKELLAPMLGEPSPESA